MAKKADYDFYFENKKETLLKKLKEDLEFQLEQAADWEFVVGKILEGVASWMHNLTHGTSGNIGQLDFYKQALIKGFYECL